MLRARRTAAASRLVLGTAGLGLLAGWPSLAAHPAIAAAGFAIIALSALVQMLTPRVGVAIEESVASVAAVLIVGFDAQRVDVLQLLWLSAVACGVLARGGRAHWVGRSVLFGALLLPVAGSLELEPAHVGFALGTLALLLTAGRLTRELSALLARARHQADYDALTGVLSRAAFDDRLERLVATSDAVSLLLIDLDGFGVINKVRGHAAGDRVLAGVGDRLTELAGDHGIAGRLGGDEFALVIPGHDPELFGDVIHALSTGDDPVSASVGLARAPEHGADADGLLRAGDIALRLAKARPTRVAAYEGRSLTDDGPDGARGVLERRVAGEGLSMVVQPIVDVTTGTAHAYEALARFEGGEGPLAWFALAAELGRRDALELACLRAALELLPDRPKGTKLSVNLSHAVLLAPSTLKLLRDNPLLDGLIVEITEEALVDDERGLRRAIAPLRERGVCLAVDDMGAGYAGLRQIAAVRPDYLKLDRSLIRDIGQSPERAALLESLVGYAERTGGHLVVEGVETHEELEVVTGLGARLVQGYLFAKPAAPWPDPVVVSVSRVRS